MAPYRKNGQQNWFSQGSGAGANPNQYILFNDPTPDPGAAFSIIVIEHLDWQAAGAGSFGIATKANNAAGLVTQQQFPMLSEEEGHGGDVRSVLRIGPVATPVPIDALLGGLPNTGATGMYGVDLSEVIFPGEAFNVLAGTAIATFVGVRYRRVSFGAKRMAPA